MTIGFCDDAMLFSGTRQVTLNGTAVTNSYVVGTQAGCAAYGTVTVTLALQAGANTLYAQICDGSSNCGSNSTVYTYDAGPDVTPPTVQISPGTQATTQATLIPVITWCDERALSSTARSITLNGASLDLNDWHFTTQTPTTSCNVRVTSTDTVPVMPGVNTLVAQVQDTAGNWGSQTVTYTNQPTIDTSPTNQFGVQPQLFDAMLSYSTPSYRSLDQDRSVTLVYSSMRARPTAMVQVDVTDNSATPADTMSLAVRWNGVLQTLPDGRTEMFYRTTAGSNRLTAVYGASATATGAKAMQVAVTRYRTAGTQVDTLPMRIVTINEGASEFGAGWSVAGLERVVQGEGGILVDHGDASGTFYPAYGAANCNLAKVCFYGHSPGDFGTMAYDSVNARYVRTSPDGTASYFDGAGRLTLVQSRLGDSLSYAYVSGRLSTITDPAHKVTTFAYDGAGKLASITDPTGRVSTFVVNASGDLVSITDPESVVALQATYTSHRVVSYTDRGSRVTNVTYDLFGRVATLQSPTFLAEGGQRSA